MTQTAISVSAAAAPDEETDITFSVAFWTRMPVAAALLVAAAVADTVRVRLAEAVALEVAVIVQVASTTNAVP
jgi:hypothetical protein